ncbi:MAG: imidazolonepropionase [Candidatus Thorarchaeota archaeon]|nr:MAG: imidazolonepropionase [Candidatus Thorarchaeota archaeon]RLI59970.1 MAG: imidazolonepropionase [Candidatus Thorarchaeota archaeon]
MRPDLVLAHIGQIATMAGHSSRPKIGDELNELSLIEDGAIVIKDGIIVAVGSTKEVLSSIDEEPLFPMIEFPSMLATPGFVDSHTHIVFGGSRENDFAMKLAGKSYLEILEAGGGILNTLRHTREATTEQLTRNAFTYAESMLSNGTTTVEAKSGYGLDTANELKMLRSLEDLRTKISVEVVRTFLGAHAVPPEYEGRTDEYVDLVVDDMIPAVEKENAAEFCDVFCEKGVFDVEQSEKVLVAAKKRGMKLKVHADEIVQLGGAELAAEVGAVSADHLLMSSDDGLEAMRKSGTIATLLPATAFSLNTAYARARDMIEMGLPVALATDFNPNCANESLFFTIALACYKMKMQPREALSAVTINAAHAIDRGEQIGSIEVGKRADILILDCPNPEYLTWRFGANLVHTVISAGEVVHTRLGP